MNCLGNRDNNIMEFLIYLTLGLPNIVISVIQIFAFQSIIEDDFTLSRPPLPTMLLFLNLWIDKPHFSTKIIYNSIYHKD